jgi:hypothetical protein
MKKHEEKVIAGELEKNLPSGPTKEEIKKPFWAGKVYSSREITKVSKAMVNKVEVNLVEFSDATSAYMPDELLQEICK